MIGRFYKWTSTVENNLRVVWRGSQRVNLSVCMYVIVKCGGIVGGGGTIKQFLFKFFVCCASKFIIKSYLALDLYISYNFKVLHKL